MDDYYELLDVAPDAPRDDIRNAYRTERDALQAGEADDTRARVAELNRVWNVLSDPAQRERYDERLADYRETGEDDDEYDDDDEDDDRASGDRAKRPVPVTRAARRDEARRARGRQQPAVVLPDGLTMASTKARVNALAFDVLILALVFVALFVGDLKLIDNHFPGARKHASDLTSQQKAAIKIEDAQKKKASAADKAAAAAKTSGNTEAEAKAIAAGKTARAAEAKATTKQKHLGDEIEAINKKLSPWISLMYLIVIVIFFLYLVPSTTLTGQTLGKRIQKIRVVTMDGGIPGWATAALRFGVPLLIGAILAVPLRFGPLGIALPVLGMIGWVTKPTRQGLHDRLAKTYVVSGP